VRVSRLGTSSLDIEYTATCNGTAACVGTITYVSVVPGTHDSTPIPDGVRALLAEHA
jgi:acyl-CoA thioesterase FadM